MFAKRSKPASSQQSPSDGDSQTVEPAPDLRDASIERLEHELAEQRALATRLRESLDAATFKAEILEKSYAKQLGEARDKRAATEAELAEKDQILANLGGGHEHTLRELNDALTVIKVLKKERDQLRKQIAQGGFRQPSATKARALLGADHDARGAIDAPGADNRAGTIDTSDDDTSGGTSGGTINALIENDGWAEKKPNIGSGQATAQVRPEPEAPQEEMLAPDLVFTAKDKE
jgi:uncharacterized coiled-coil protein SlyX